MKVSVEWLRELVDVDVGVDELAHKLNMSGTKVERVVSPGEEIDGVVVAEVLGIHDHPNADALTLVDLRAGDSGEQRVVCGARNFAVGDRVAFAPVGSRIPGMGVAERKIRGEASRGMLCSGAELGVSKDHAGILVLPSDSEPGVDVVGLLGLDDTIIELEITPNRPDCLGMIGIAREVAALLGKPLHMPAASQEASNDLQSAVAVEIADPQGCSRYQARYVDRVTVGSSPAWMVRRLLAGGIRAISNVVDITNYVLLETSQPLHAFDAAKIAERKIVVRRAHSGERLTTLDGVERTMSSEDLLIADPTRPLGIAGVIGGGGSEVSDSTSAVILEAAHFDPASIAFTSRRHGLRTDASVRFERGADPAMVTYASGRAVELMASLAGGTIASRVVDEHPRPAERRRIRLRPARTERLLGIPIPAERQAAWLEAIGLEIEAGDGGLEAVVPTGRPDLIREVDLIEEVARLVGFDRLRSTIPSGPSGGLELAESAERTLKRTLTALGVSEAWTPSLFSERGLDDLGLEQNHPARSVARLSNPMSQDEGAMRSTLLPGLLRSVAHNVARGVSDVALFEIARVYEPTDGVLPTERLVLGLAMTGARASKSWSAAERSWDFFSAKGILDASLSSSLGSIAPTYARVSGMPFHPGRAAEVSLGDVTIGVLGELHPEVCERFDVPPRTISAELAVDALLAHPSSVVEISESTRFPPIYMDLAVVVDSRTEAGSVASAIRHGAGPDLAGLRLFDLYEGEQVPRGRKSLAFALELRAPDRTLTDEDATRVRERIVSALRERVDGELRTRPVTLDKDPGGLDKDPGERKQHGEA